jgi:1-acyl-sn-glycerol-3-phosphate acyltransferase
MSRLLYKMATGFGRFIFWQTMNLHLVHPERGQQTCPYILALTHIGNIDPFMLCLTLDQKIDWMARKEYFHNPLARVFMRQMDAFCVRREGVPISAIRISLDRLARGRCLGICPEGGTAQGKNSVMRGGPIKQGVCLISYRTGAPVVPVVMLGVEKLNAIKPWLPFKRAHLWIGFGEPIVPPKHITDRREARRVMAGQLTAAYMSLYAEVRQTFGIDDSQVP